jgi:methyl-accepting chemotaxis protein
MRIAQLLHRSTTDRTAEAKGMLDAIDKALAVIEFDLDGHVLTANRNFLSVIGYELQETSGR